jgi:hypothetical protein
MTKLNREDVLAAFGAVEDVAIAELLASGTTAEELAEARAWIAADDALVQSGRSLPATPSGRVAQLIAMIGRVEEDEEPLLGAR